MIAISYSNINELCYVYEIDIIHINFIYTYISQVNRRSVHLGI